jgi:PBSX family phage terminase large subunit
MLNLKNLRRITILQGAVRSGKTWVSLMAWAVLVASFEKNAVFLMVGKTLTSLKRNCLLPLQNLVSPVCFTFSVSSKEGLLFGRKIFFEGVNDVRAENKIRGLTLKGAYCDELTIFTEDFFVMLLSRISEKDSFLLGTTNPDSPMHWLKKKYIDRKIELGMDVWDFGLCDNDFLDKTVVDALKKEYTGVFYDRFILGKWAAAEGLIYRQFADNPQKYIVENAQKALFQTVHIGIDYGASRSRTAFTAVGFTEGYGKLYVLREKTSLGIKSPEEIYNDFLNFYLAIQKEFGIISHCFADYGALGQILTRGISNFFVKKGKPIKVIDCQKHRIIDRINMLCRLIASDRFAVHKSCVQTIEALSSAVWEDEKDDVRLDDGTINVDVLDSLEYAFSSYLVKFSAGDAGLRREKGEIMWQF